MNNPEDIIRDSKTGDYRQAQHTDKYTQQKAEELGCVVEYSKPNILQIDLDGEQAYQTFLSQIKLMIALNIIPLDSRVVARPSKSGNIHIMLVMPEYTDMPVSKRIQMQALLGSDLKRETLAVAGLQDGRKNPLVLFRPKEGATMPSYFNPEDIEQVNVGLSDMFLF